MSLLGFHAKMASAGSYLRFAEFVPLWDHVELDSIYSSRQQCSADQQDCQDHVWKCSREIYHLNIINLASKEINK